MEENDTTFMSDQTPTTHLEPRVAKLEAGLDILTKNVTDLTMAVRDNANNLEGKFERLTIAVTQAQAPKKTDWSTIFAGIMLVLAIGSAVFWPLNQVSQDNKDRLEKVSETLTDHQKIDMHPVGWAVVQRLEGQIRDHVVNNERESDMMRKHHHEEMEHIQKLVDAKTALLESEAKGSQKYNELYIDKLFGRVQVLENERTKTADKEHEELLQWRQKAMGLTSADEVVPFVSRDPLLNRSSSNQVQK